MIGYYSTSAMLNLFSLNGFTMDLYRKLGNLKNARAANSAILPRHYLERTGPFLDMVRRHDLVRTGDKVMEVGTGWVHWESLMLRHEIDCDITLYDVWDNRSFERFQTFAAQVARHEIRQQLGLQNTAGATLLTEVSTADTFADAYEMLGFKYILDQHGELDPVPDNSRDFIFASDVAEHLPRHQVPEILRQTHQKLKPGGHLYHQIVLTDHLRIYDRSVHHKEYLKYSGSFFDRWINNKVQYINRLQLPEWRTLFRDAGFELVEERRLVDIDLAPIKIHADYTHMTPADLSCAVVQVLLRKPVAN